ncbi:MAG: prolipoprotein diacylglyceryl transferase [Acidimicrobiia bacterium]|nr:prolipoprotein diacylglyceryl transferase [Acidimicrobiia bacterium]
MEFTLLWAALTGVSFAWLGVRLWRDGLPPKPFDVLLGAGVVGLITGRLAAMVIQGINPFSNPGQFILVRGGVHTGFASIGALAALIWLLRGRIRPMDALTPAALFALAGWHAGCVWRSACLGTASQLPWAWSQEGSAVTRHPVELYAAVGLAAAGLIIGRLPLKPLLRFGTGLGAAGAVRLVTEPMRHTITGGPVSWYVAAVLLGAATAIAGRVLEDRLERVST